MFFFSLYFLFPCKDPGLHENVETKPRETEEPEAEDDLSDVPDNELGAVVEFDEDELDEAQTEADVKNITTKHQITIEELKREVLGSVKKSVFFIRSCSVGINPITVTGLGLCGCFSIEHFSDRFQLKRVKLLGIFLT